VYVLSPDKKCGGVGRGGGEVDEDFYVQDDNEVWNCLAIKFTSFAHS
jgi:hypothetical protein